MTPEKVYAPSEPVAITLTMEEWQSVLHWLQYGGSYHNCKKAEVLANCKDGHLAAEYAKIHEAAAAEAERVYKIVEAAVYQAATPTETE